MANLDIVALDSNNTQLRVPAAGDSYNSPVPLAMSGNAISGLPMPSGDSEPATKQYADLLQLAGVPVTVLTLTLTGGDRVLTSTEYLGNVAIDVSGVLAADQTITLPNGAAKLLVIDNLTTGNFTLTVRNTTDTGVVLNQNARLLVYSTGIAVEGVGVTALIASGVSNTPSGNIAATDVQAAITELDTEKLTATHGTDTANPHNTTAAQVGLGSVDNTADTAKPVSTAQQTALDLKAPLASPTFTGDSTVVGVTETSPAANTATIDLAVGTVFNYTAATAITLPVVSAGKSFTVVCAVPPTSWTGTVTWTGGAVPVPTAAQGCVFVFIANADATAWYGTQSMDGVV